MKHVFKQVVGLGLVLLVGR